MKFGPICELSTPRPFTRETQKAVFEHAIEQVVLADELQSIGDRSIFRHLD